MSNPMAVLFRLWSMSFLARVAAVIALTTAGLLTGFQPAAHASCAMPPPESPAVFTGTVESTERDGLVAHVRTDDGRQVDVVGTPSESGVTSVDRTFTKGVRYEFHPLNASSPYQDNICTRTHAVDSAPPTAPTPSTAGGPGVKVAIGIGGALVVLGGGFIVGMRIRRHAGRG
ncbi:hypothetical protein [Lentzea sp. NBRC 105346]|uniref:hypothetical protein n=1 Tax=Lentzea sp. NBRC 105346 TaxID=3032205 RepID=UPI0025571466|nr:hypothetical protein [Lentzea sp. NBRC 105346]